MKVALIDYDAGNLRSVEVALRRCGADVVVTNKESDLLDADKVVFPGVGHAGAAMQSLVRYGLDKIIPSLKQDVLGICLGMQLMCKHSAEGDTDALNIFPLSVIDFEKIEFDFGGTGLKIPHTGWSATEHANTGLFRNIDPFAFFYYVHKYCVMPNEYSIASCQHGIRFSAAIQHENFYAVQFHPEKSGHAGHTLLNNFLYAL